MIGIRQIALVVFAAAVATGTASAESVEDFYRGKQIQLLIGGNPTIKVENMPRASSLIMTNRP